MKTKKKQPKHTIEPLELMSLIELPPWQRCRSKKSAYLIGRDGCELQIRREVEADYQKRRQEVIDKEKNVEARLDALKSICQVSTVLAESVSKAYLAFEKVL